MLKFWINALWGAINQGFLFPLVASIEVCRKELGVFLSPNNSHSSHCQSKLTLQDVLTQPLFTTTVFYADHWTAAAFLRELLHNPVALLENVC